MRVSDLYCPSCRNAKDHKPRDNEVCWSCVAIGGAVNYKESKTNADRIREMTDEELASLFSDYRQEHWCPPDSGDCVEYCTDCWLNWLKQGAEA